ncbi:MAG: SIMPL domain-containing protein [Myxococcales bacterium]|nr:SIMPL domain-containing protein [Myxococcales bacterium]
MSVRPKRPALAWLFVAGLAGAASSVLAADPATSDPRPEIQLSAAAEREVPNDLMRVTLAVESENRDPARLAQQINTSMQWAVERARGVDGVEIRSGGYQTFPVHQKGKLLHWRARQDLQLESRDTDRLSALVGELQTRLAVKSMALAVSTETRRKVENQLIDVALDRFKQRAEIVRRNLDAGSYDLGTLTIHTAGAPPPVPMRGGGMRVTALQAAPAAVEAGTSTIAVRVSGSIRLP